MGTTVVRGRLDPDLEDFCAEAFPRLVGALVPVCGDVGVAEEVAQEALVRVVERWDHVRGMAYPMSWAHRVAYNIATSRFRRRAAERRAFLRHGAPDPATEPDDLPDVAGAMAVRSALATLPERQRRAVALRYFADLPVAAVAEEMGITPGSVKVMTSRGLASLRRALDDAVPAGPTTAPVAPLDADELASRVDHRRSRRRTTAVVASMLVLAVALVWGRTWVPFERPPVVDTPESLEDLSWGDPVEHDVVPVLNDFLPTQPVIEVGGLLWSVGPDVTLQARSTIDAAVVTEVDVAAAGGRTVCHLERSGDGLLVALLCPAPDPGATTQPTGVLVLDPDDPGAARVVDREPWNAAVDAVELLDGDVWTIGLDTLTRVDASTGEETELALPDGVRPRALAGGFGSLWVTTPPTPGTPEDATGELLRIDPVDGSVVARLPLGDTAGAAATVGRVAPHDLAVGETRVWVELAGEGRLAAVDPTTNAVVAHAELGVAPGGGRVVSASGRTRPVAAAGGIWAHVGGRVVAVDPVTGAVRATTPDAPVQDPGDVSGIAVTERGDVWFGDWRRRVVVQLPVAPG